METQELRHGIVRLEGAREAYPLDIVAAMTVADIFDSFGVRLDGPSADGVTLTIAWRFSATNFSAPHTAQ